MGQQYQQQQQVSCFVVCSAGRASMAHSVSQADQGALSLMRLARLAINHVRHLAPMAIEHTNVA